ncbi:F-box/LRR-repeat protein 4 [Anopheles funestus]|uniref:F-box/LRR-repeat protein 4 n=1 Tax=Anopheles funestus TaxID=62324 RepID=UPI0020C61C4B|nr:F-box/LRR-repeat protein 4 [Anopheles funestus]XP_049299098.1 F-box/LRR-repeat protein 4 [Anopheles funestus]
MNSPEVRENRRETELQQYVEEICYASSEYGPMTSISYNSINVIGRPNNFPEHGDHSDTYLLTTYGNWRMRSPSYTPEFGVSKIPAIENPPIDDFIVVRFERSVHPLGVEVYETLNPGAVNRIWAYTETKQWVLLWDRRTDPICEDVRNVGLTKSNVFVPAIRILSQRTRVLCLEFNTRHLNYIYGIDAIMLKSALNAPDSAEPAYSNDVCIVDAFMLPCLVNDAGKLQADNALAVSHWQPDRQLQPVAAKQQQPKTITDLPYEMMYHIFSYLDLKSLRVMEEVSSKFHHVVRDKRLYREVNMRPYWMEINFYLLQWLYRRCNQIRKLDLSWCGLFNKLTEEQLKCFLMRHGESLTHLRLNTVGIRQTICFVLSLCPNVEELCLQNMHIGDRLLLTDRLTKLTKLDLAGGSISSSTLNNILRLNHNLQHLNLSCCEFERFPIAKTIGRYNHELISLNLFKARALDADDLVPLANCTKLEELNLGYSNVEEMEEGALSQLLEACPNMRKLVLSGFWDVYNNDMLTIAQHCRRMEYLDLMGCITVTGESVNAIFIGCPALRFLEINHCSEISSAWITQWKTRYPHVDIKHQAF